MKVHHWFIHLRSEVKYWFFLPEQSDPTPARGKARRLH